MTRPTPPNNEMNFSIQIQMVLKDILPGLPVNFGSLAYRHNIHVEKANSNEPFLNLSKNEQDTLF